MNREKILEIKNLKQYFKIDRKNIIKAVNDISFSIYEGEFLGLVGESGSGKSTIGRSIVGINRVTSGEVIFKGKNIANKKIYRQERKTINKDIQFIFQDSVSSLNSRMTIGEIIGEPLKIQKLCKSKKERETKVLELMNLVGLDEDYFNKYPYDFSGGQRQRIGIARALAVEPKIIIADEPIASLDVSMQGKIINLFRKLKKEKNLTCLFIAHDLSMVGYISDRIAVMKNGKILEIAPSKELYENPIHPYTKSLIASIPKPDPKYKNIYKTTYKENINYSRGKLVQVGKEHFVYKVEEKISV